jgi:hypothetical protein
MAGIEVATGELMIEEVDFVFMDNLGQPFRVKTLHDAKLGPRIWLCYLHTCSGEWVTRRELKLGELARYRQLKTNHPWYYYTAR